MTKAKYMALDDLQTVWDERMKPYIQQTYTPVTDQLKPVNVAALTPSSTFVKNAVIGINGVIYRAKQATSHFPVTLVTDSTSGTEQFVIESVNGKIAFVIDDQTVDSDWEVWTDAGIEYWIAQIGSSLTALAARVTALEAVTPVLPTTSYGGHTAAALLTAVASLMGKTVVLNEG